ncbi:hypothetical protein E3P99_03206 [Wallemia hederae]|uniref:Translation machinery-associated protein 16 n=1 Tax=Wallemia hederae TaxID=1540922 RepID=A0A4T0FHF6_9BASI|nr:hypothetical protein E3P99_03206 [Wallemia hederae]
MKKIKNRESLHPGSRKAEQVTRVNLRLNKLDQKKKAMDTDKSNKMARYHYIAGRIAELDPQPSRISVQDLHSLVEQYINREDEVYGQLKSEREARDKSLKRKSGRSAREGEIEVRKERELSEFKSGFVVPDLTDETTMHLFKQFPSARKLSKKTRGKTQSSVASQDNSMAVDSLDDEELSKHGLDINYLPQLKLVRVYMDNAAQSDVVQQGQNPIYKAQQA